MRKDRPTNRSGAARGAGSGRSKGGFVPQVRFERAAPTLQQTGEMAEGLRILCEWLLRRHKRVAQNAGGNTSDGDERTPKKNLDFPAPPSPHVT